MAARKCWTCSFDLSDGDEITAFQIYDRRTGEFGQAIMHSRCVSLDQSEEAKENERIFVEMATD